MICTHCEGSGSLSKELGGELDCAHCDAAVKRAALNNELKDMDPADHRGRAWVAFQLGRLDGLTASARKG